LSFVGVADFLGFFCSKTSEMLEKESLILLNSPPVSKFCRGVLDGNWKLVRKKKICSVDCAVCLLMCLFFFFFFFFAFPFKVEEHVLDLHLENHENLNVIIVLHFSPLFLGRAYFFFSIPAGQISDL
jgi:hypothetical protein